jgi:hypothetical protein
MGVNIFTDPTKSVPTRDKQIVRVDMETQEIGGRKSSLPTEGKSQTMGISHVPNAGSKS